MPELHEELQALTQEFLLFLAESVSSGSVTDYPPSTRRSRWVPSLPTVSKQRPKGS